MNDYSYADSAVQCDNCGMLFPAASADERQAKLREHECPSVDADEDGTPYRHEPSPTDETLPVLAE